MNLSESIVIAVSVIAAGIGVFGLASPAGMIRFVSTWQSKSGLWMASAIRLVLGIALWASSDGSRFPATFKVLSVVSLASSVALPLMGGFPLQVDSGLVVQSIACFYAGLVGSSSVDGCISILVGDGITTVDCRLGELQGENAAKGGAVRRALGGLFTVVYAPVPERGRPHKFNWGCPYCSEISSIPAIEW